jgi:hypothetical protein
VTGVHFKYINRRRTMEGKTIVFCADGTWNGVPTSSDAPQAHSAVAADTTTEVGEGLPGCTNVYKVFDYLAGDLVTAASNEKEREKVFGPPDNPTQVAKYIHGVGDSPNVVQKFAEGAFGIGVVARIARGYTYISRNYKEGDRIVIVGFSRGAYTARALAGLITTMGLLRPDLAENPDDKYQHAFAAWYKYRELKKHGWVDRLVHFFTKVTQKGLLTPDLSLSDDSFVGAGTILIEAVGVWDTVGAMGIPIFDLKIPGATVDLFKFTDTALNDQVLHGFHALSIDEKRPPFTPTLWENRKNVTQRLFAGAHSDVGGGYTEHGLADCALKWMIESLQSHTSVQFSADKLAPISGKPLDTAHRPWTKMSYQLMGPEDRVFPKTYHLAVDPSVRDRMQAPGVAPDRGMVPEPYQPKNIEGIPFADENGEDAVWTTMAAEGLPPPFGGANAKPAPGAGAAAP